MESLRRLRAFAVTCETGNAAQAARRVHLSQPAVSAAIAVLERAAQSTLFDRGNRGMTPTAAGRRLLGRVLAGLDHLDIAAAQLRGRGALPSRWPWLATAVQLRALCALAETRGLSSAARALGVAEPSVHRALRSFEALAGVSLWRRAGSAIELAPEAVRMGFEELRELRGQLDGELRVGALPMPRSHWLPRALAATLQGHPGARAQVMDGPYENQLAALRSGQIDVLLGALRFPAPGADVAQEPLFDDPLSIVVRADHPLVTARGRTAGGPTNAQLRRLASAARDAGAADVRGLHELERCRRRSLRRRVQFPDRDPVPAAAIGLRRAHLRAADRVRTRARQAAADRSADPRDRPPDRARLAPRLSADRAAARLLGAGAPLRTPAAGVGALSVRGPAGGLELLNILLIYIAIMR
jgi:LysR family transcriptional regulator, regulator for genes of the gallate degradation pathway